MLDPFDELAAMFLTDDEPIVDQPRGATNGRGRGTDDGDTRPRTSVDLVIPGHLPVRAGLWLPAFADAVARKTGPLGMVRLDSAFPSVQFVRGGGEATSGPTLAACIDSIPEEPARWMISPSADCGADEMVHVDADRIIILSGPDEMAVVRAYQIIKSLKDAADGSGNWLPDLMLAVVGADDAEARQVAARLHETTSGYLGLSIELLLCLPRMDSNQRSGLPVTPEDTTHPPLDLVMQWIRNSQRSEAAQPVVPPPLVVADDDDEVEAECVAPTSETQETPETPVAIEPPASAPTMPTPETLTAEVAREDPPVVRTMRLRPKVGRVVEPREDVATAEPSDDGRPTPLTRFITGLTVLPARCPDHEDIELAVDPGGVMHLVGREDSVDAMHVVERWASKHRELLAMACRDHTIDATHEAVYHVITDTPLNVAHLHGSDLYLHVLAPINVNGRVGWYAAPLNRP